MQPTAFARSRVEKRTAAKIVSAKGGGTCHIGKGKYSNIDYFVISESLEHKIDKATVDMNATTPVHRPVQVALKADGVSATRICRPKCAPTEPIRQGPYDPKRWRVAQMLASFAVTVACTSENASEVNEALATGYKAFASEFQIEAAFKTAEEPPQRQVVARGVTLYKADLLHEAKVKSETRKLAITWLIRRVKEFAIWSKAGQVGKMEEHIRKYFQYVPPWAQPGSKPYEPHPRGESAQTEEQAMATQPDNEPLADKYARVKAMCHDLAKAHQLIADLDRQLLWEEAEGEQQQLVEQAELEDREDQIAQRGSWKRWVQQAIEKGGRLACNFAKGPHDWRPQQTKNGGSANPERLLDEMYDKCKKLWADPNSKWTCELAPVSERAALPKLTHKQIRDAGLSNPQHKAVAYDGFHPRHYGHLSQGGAEVFATLWQACEFAGMLPPQVSEALAPLIPKKAGGYRDLALCSSFYRCGMKARRPYAQKWEDENDRYYFASGANRSCDQAIWRASLAAETAIYDNMAAGVVVQDMTAFFQAVDLKLLGERAKRLEFPMCLARLATAQYTGPRWLYTDEGVAKAVSPNRGIAPGCSIATTLVKVYYIETLDEFVKECAQKFGESAVGFQAYIDDFLIEA